MDGMVRSTMTAGGAIFARLGVLGVDYVFCNSGTDFPPIIEGLAEAAAMGIELPQAVTIPHEHAALGMAHGYYQATGRAQAVMLHTNVGLANGAIGAINAACDQVPMLLMSGRTPVTEHSRFGARTIPIGWGQEMRDQTALVREAVKWDYELRFPEQIAELLDRAHAIANSTPKGPVYLSLPREVLCEPIDAAALQAARALAAAVAGARAEDVRALAAWIARAERPVLFAQRGAGSKAGFATMTRLVDDWALPVCDYWATAMAIPTNHAMAVGGDPASWLAAADLILVIDSLAPWQPDIHTPSVDAKIVHLGPNPLQARTPVRNFRSDLSLTGEVDETLARLAEALAPLRADHVAKIEARHAVISARSEDIRAEALEDALAGNRAPMSKAWVSKCLSDAVAAQDRKACIISELGCRQAGLVLDHHDAYRQEPHSGGLGYGLPAALGVQLAEPDSLVFATVGDGSYMFANPTACHQIAEALALPVVTLVLNNGEWGAVRQSVAGLYPEGHAMRANTMPLTALRPSPDFTKTAAASRAYAETVEAGCDLPAALERAIAVATNERRQALLDIRIGPGSG
jgi:acetolactate synthase-1/2/3 large subunit